MTALKFSLHAEALDHTEHLLIGFTQVGYAKSSQTAARGGREVKEDSARKRGERRRGLSVVSCSPRIGSQAWFSIPWGVPKILIAVGNAGLHHLHPHIVPPIVAQLTCPLKVSGVRNICIH